MLEIGLHMKKIAFVWHCFQSFDNFTFIGIFDVILFTSVYELHSTS